MLRDEQPQNSSDENILTEEIQNNLNEALTNAVVRNDHAVAHGLLLKGARQTFKDSNYGFPLHIAVIHRNVQMVESLLVYACNEAILNSPNKYEQTPFLLAVQAKNFEIIAKIVKHANTKKIIIPQDDLNEALSFVCTAFDKFHNMFNFDLNGVLVVIECIAALIIAGAKNEFSEEMIKLFNNPQVYLQRAEFCSNETNEYLLQLTSKPDRIQFAFNDYVKFIEMEKNDKTRGQKGLTELLSKKVTSKFQMEKINKDKFVNAIYMLDEEQQYLIKQLCITEGHPLNEYLLADELNSLDGSAVIKIGSDDKEHKGRQILEKITKPVFINEVINKSIETEFHPIQNNEDLPKKIEDEQLKMQQQLDMVNQMIIEHPDDTDNYFQSAVICQGIGLNKKDASYIKLAFNSYRKFIEMTPGQEGGHEQFANFLKEISDAKLLQGIDKSEFGNVITKLAKGQQSLIMELCTTEGSCLRQYLLSEEAKVEISFWTRNSTQRVITADNSEHKGFAIFQKMRIDYSALINEKKSQMDSNIENQLNIFDQMIKENPDDADNYSQRAVFCASIGISNQNIFLIKTAFYNYVEFIKRTPGNIDGHKDLANFLMNIHSPALLKEITKLDFGEAVNLLHDESKLSIIKLCMTEGHPLNTLLISEEVHNLGIGFFCKIVTFDNDRHNGRKVLVNMLKILNESNKPKETMEEYYNSNFMM